MLTIPFCSAAFAATAVDVVRKAQAAQGHVSYRGSKTACVTVGGRMVCSQMQVTHLKPNSTRTQYDSPKAVSGTVVIQRGDAVWKYIPSRKAWERQPCGSTGISKCGLDIALSNYSLRLSGSQKLLGRDSYVVVATPKRAGESVVRLWIDKQSYLTLKTQIEKPSGQVISSTSFSKIAINPKDISASVFAVPADNTSARPSVHPHFRVSRPKYLPVGYRLIGEACGKACGHECVHLQFSNGVNTISLFERTVSARGHAPCLPGKLTGVKTWTRHGMLFTLIGDLPPDELRKIANSTP